MRGPVSNATNTRNLKKGIEKEAYGKKFKRRGIGVVNEYIQKPTP